MKKLFFALCTCSVMVLTLTAFAPLIAMAAEAEEAVPGADIVAAILGYLPASWGGWVTLIISVCAAVAAFWPRPKDDAPLPLRLLYAVINAIGFNFKKAQNVDTGKSMRIGGGGV